MAKEEREAYNQDIKGSSRELFLDRTTHNIKHDIGISCHIFTSTTQSWTLNHHAMCVCLSFSSFSLNSGTVLTMASPCRVDSKRFKQNTAPDWTRLANVVLYPFPYVTPSNMASSSRVSSLFPIVLSGKTSCDDNLAKRAVFLFFFFIFFFFLFFCLSFELLGTMTLILWGECLYHSPLIWFLLLKFIVIYVMLFAYFMFSLKKNIYNIYIR